MTSGQWEPANAGAPVPPPGHIPCAVCDDPIAPAEYDQAVVWPDPTGRTALLAGHAICHLVYEDRLARVEERLGICRRCHGRGHVTVTAACPNCRPARGAPPCDWKEDPDTR